MTYGRYLGGYMKRCMIKKLVIDHVVITRNYFRETNKVEETSFYEP